MQQKTKPKHALVLAVLLALAIAVIALFVLWGLNGNNIAYNLPRRLKKVAAIALTGSAIASSSLVFQIITNNRILTPSVMGLDSLFQFMQTLVAFLFGAGSLEMTSKYLDFGLSTGLMVVFSLALCTLIFTRPGQNLFVLVLVGMVCGSFFSSLSGFMQAVIDPNEYLILQGKMFASFNTVNTPLLGVSAFLIGGSLLYFALTRRRLDVLSLGRENAINLGVSYNRSVFVYLMLVSLLVAVSTALVGPVTFLGVLVVNLARQIMRTFRHGLLFLCSSLLSIVALVGGQVLVERPEAFRWVLRAAVAAALVWFLYKAFIHMHAKRAKPLWLSLGGCALAVALWAAGERFLTGLDAFSTPVSVIVNFVGGIYFIFLLLKERNL